MPSPEDPQAVEPGPSEPGPPSAATSPPAYDPVADATWPAVDLAGVTELRVHGVGGTPPADMLDSLDVVQVAGDRTAGVWRAADPAPGRHLEAYAWGGLTARRTISALWLLVLPFALVNIAGWMAPTTEEGGRSAWLFPRLVRAFGLLMTVLYVEFVITAAMDFAAYQCAAATGCALASWPLIGVDGFGHDPARRVALGALVPMALVAGLWWVTRGSRRAYEGFGGGDLDLVADSSMVQIRRGLSSPGFWKGQAYAIRLAHLHFAAALAAIAYPLAKVSELSADSSLARILALAASAVLLVAVLLAFGTSTKGDRLPLYLLVVSVLLVASTWGWAWIVAPTATWRADPARVLPGGQMVFDMTIALALIGAIGAFATALGSASGAGRVRFARAATPATVLVTATFITLTVLAGVALWIAQRLGRAISFGQKGAPSAIEYSQAFGLLARGSALVLVIVLVAAAWSWFTAGESASAAARDRAEATWRDLPVPPRWRDCRGEGLSTTVRQACRLPVRSLAAAEKAVWALGLTTMLLTAAYAVPWLEEMQRTGFDQPHIALDLGWFTRIPVGPFTWFLTVLPLAMVFLLRQGLTNPSARRLIAIAWDVATFWPRAFHPLAPPSYAERAVPELSARLRRLWAGGGPDERGAVILLAHSQGSVLATAALAAADTLLPTRPGDRPLANRLRLITYGSPVQRLYARYYPAYFTEDLLAEVRGRLTDETTGAVVWTNFYRDTDYVGNRIFPGEAEGPESVDHYLVDPPHPFAPGGDPTPPVRAHSETGYRRQLAFRERRAAAAQELTGSL